MQVVARLSSSIEPRASKAEVDPAARSRNEKSKTLVRGRNIQNPGLLSPSLIQMVSLWLDIYTVDNIPVIAFRFFKEFTVL